MTQPDQKLINVILWEATDASAALASLNRLQKARFDHWSMQYVCKKAGIPSTGYFSDVLKGKRSLHLKHLPGVARAFGLESIQTRFLEQMLLRDQAEDPKVRADAEAGIAKTIELMQVQYIPVPAQLSADLVFHVLVLSAFSLFQGNPRQKDLENFFGKAAAIPLAKSLHSLESMGLIKKDGDGFSLTQTRIIFQDSEDGFSHLDFLEASIRHAGRKAKQWFPKKTESALLSTIVTVKRDDYEAKISDVKKRILEILAELEAKQGDQLVHFNVQIFPADPSSMMD